MTAHQQDITVLIASLCLAIALLGLMVAAAAFAFPAVSSTGKRLFASGLVLSLTATLSYLIYISTVYLTLSEIRP